jgi:hypothetical protein
MAFMHSALMSLLTQAPFTNLGHHDHVSSFDKITILKIRQCLFTAYLSIYTAIPEIQVSLSVSALICIFPWPSDHRARKAQANVPQRDGREASVPRRCATFDAHQTEG